MGYAARRTGEILIGGLLAISGYAVEEVATDLVSDQLQANDALMGRPPSDSIPTNLFRYAVQDQAMMYYAAGERFIGGIDASEAQQEVMRNTAVGNVIGFMGYGTSILLITTGGAAMTGAFDQSNRFRRS